MELIVLLLENKKIILFFSNILQICVLLYCKTFSYILQVLALLVAVILRAMVSVRRRDIDDEDDYERGRAREPLLNPQSNHTSTSAKGDGRVSHSDFWGSRIREKVSWFFSIITHVLQKKIWDNPLFALWVYSIPCQILYAIYNSGLNDDHCVEMVPLSCLYRTSYHYCQVISMVAGNLMKYLVVVWLINDPTL